MEEWNEMLKQFISKRHTEVWKEVEEYPSYYISNLGRVKRKYMNGKELIMKLFTDVKKYKYVALYQNKKRKAFKIHRLVGFAFITNDNIAYNQIDHIIREKDMNHSLILRWCNNQINQMNTPRTRNDIEEQDPKKRRKEIEKIRKQKIIDSKKNYCPTCNYAFESPSALKKHETTSQKHAKNLTKVKSDSTK